MIKHLLSKDGCRLCNYSNRSWRHLFIDTKHAKKKLYKAQVNLVSFCSAMPRKHTTVKGCAVSIEDGLKNNLPVPAPATGFEFRLWKGHYMSYLLLSPTSSKASVYIHRCDQLPAMNRSQVELCLQGIILCTDDLQIISQTAFIQQGGVFSALL